MMLYSVVFIVFSSLKCFVCEIKKLQVSGHLANQMDLVYRITARCMPVVSLIFEHRKCLRLCVCYAEEIALHFSRKIQIHFESRCMAFSPSRGLGVYSLFLIKKNYSKRIFHMSYMLCMFDHICLTLRNSRECSNKFL